SHALLVREHAGDNLPAEIAGILPFHLQPEPALAKKARPSRPWGPVLAAAAAVTLLVNGYLLWKKPGSSPVEPSHIPGVAVLSRLVGAEWSNREKVPAEGS